MHHALFSFCLDKSKNLKNMNICSRSSVRKVASFVFTIVFFVHIIRIGCDLYYPDNPHVKIYTKILKNMQFPISIRLCVREMENTTHRYNKIGYENEKYFFIGRSMFNKSLFGWKGHTYKSNGALLGSVEGRFRVKRKLLFLIFRCPEKRFLRLEKDRCPC